MKIDGFLKRMRKRMKRRLLTSLLILMGACLSVAASPIDDSIGGVIDTEHKEKTTSPHDQPTEKKHPQNKQKPEIWDMDGPSSEADGINGR